MRGDREYIRDGETCAECGTDLKWWLKQRKRNKVYLHPSDDAFCSKKCVHDYDDSSLYEIKVMDAVKLCPTCNQEIKEADNGR